MADEVREKPGRGLQWPAIIIGLLGLNVGVCAVTLTAALRSPAEIEPDYYDQALNWDEHRETKTEE